MLSLSAVLFLLTSAAAAQTVDEIVAKYVETIGGMQKLQAIKTMRATGKFTGPFQSQQVWIAVWNAVLRLQAGARNHFHRRRPSQKTLQDDADRTAKVPPEKKLIKSRIL